MDGLIYEDPVFKVMLDEKISFIDVVAAVGDEDYIFYRQYRLSKNGYKYGEYGGLSGDEFNALKCYMELADYSEINKLGAKDAVLSVGFQQFLIDKANEAVKRPARKKGTAIYRDCSIYHSVGVRIARGEARNPTHAFDVLTKDFPLSPKAIESAYRRGAKAIPLIEYHQKIKLLQDYQKYLVAKENRLEEYQEYLVVKENLLKSYQKSLQEHLAAKK